LLKMTFVLGQRRMIFVLRDLGQPAILLAAGAVGIALSFRMSEAVSPLTKVITPLLMGVLFTLFARVSLGRLRVAARDWRYQVTALALNFGTTPLVAYLLGWAFLRDDPALWAGLFLALITPCTDWYLIFTEVAGGDVHKNLVLLPWNLILQLALLPLYLLIFTQALVPVDFDTVGRAIAIYIAVPLAAGQFVRRYFPRLALSPGLNRFGFAALALTVVAMFASHGDIVLQRPTLFLRLAPPMLAFYVISLSLSWMLSRWGGYPQESFVALACTTMARNSPLVWPLAIILFPAHPVVALSQLVEPLLEIPSLIIFTALAQWRRPPAPNQGRKVIPHREDER